jgi:hypothetical protein
MLISVYLPRRIDQKLAHYCASHQVAQSTAGRRALEQVIEHPTGKASARELGKRFSGTEKSGGDIARRSERLLRERFANRDSLG